MLDLVERLHAIPDQLSKCARSCLSGEMRTVLAHEVKIAEGTRIAVCVGRTIVNVKHHHHQGLKDIAPSLRVAGMRRMELVEASNCPIILLDCGAMASPNG